MIGVLGAEPALQHLCSRAACVNQAAWALLWRNPAIHNADRTKTWLACDEHVDYLTDFLSSRSFPLEVISIETLMAREEGILQQQKGAGH